MRAATPESNQSIVEEENGRFPGKEGTDWSCDECITMENCIDRLLDEKLNIYKENRKWKIWGNHEHQRKKSKKGNNHSELLGTSVDKVCTVKIMSCKYECQFNLQL